ncbi:MAG: Zn-dependent alcohol dehydrogenase [Actinomycetia bacterium]|nr:Zn-dependent alcohol dehydrogenase [Actinomycetes bacterium]
MKAAVLHEYRQPLVIEEVEVLPPRAGEVLVRFVASGVCHSDLTRIQGERPSSLPIILGHEGAGIVEEVGPGVTTVKPGDHVVLSWIYGCGQCEYCTVGRPNLCRVGIKMLTGGTFPDGSTRFRIGDQPVHHMVVSSFGEMGVVPEACAIPVPAEVPLERAVVVGCGVMTGVGAVMNTARVHVGATVAVVGAGGVGLNVVQGAVLAGARQIIAVDILDAKLEMARRFGATHGINGRRENVVEAVRDLTGGLGVDYAFEVLGRPETIRQAYDMVKPGGMAVVVGISPADSEVALPAMQIPFQEKMLVGSFYGGARPRVDIPRLIDLYRTGRLKLDELVTRTYRPEQINQALHDLEAGELARGVVVY